MEYSCCPYENGCQRIFECDEDPHECPHCGVIFCGIDCCGFYAVEVNKVWKTEAEIKELRNLGEAARQRDEKSKPR
jgi:hypothetical protein